MHNGEHKMPTEKKYKIKQTIIGRGRNNSEKIIEGTLAEITKYFSYTLEVGHSYDKKIKLKPTTIVSFMSNLNKALDIEEGACYSRTSIELIK